MRPFFVLNAIFYQSKIEKVEYFNILSGLITKEEEFIDDIIQINLLYFFVDFTQILCFFRANLK